MIDDPTAVEPEDEDYPDVRSDPVPEDPPPAADEHLEADYEDRQSSDGAEGDAHA